MVAITRVYLKQKQRETLFRWLPTFLGLKVVFVLKYLSILEICNNTWSISDKMIIDTIAPALLLLYPHLNVVEWYWET